MIGMIIATYVVVCVQFFFTLYVYERMYKKMEAIQRQLRELEHSKMAELL